jgi:hypothetical protein
MTYKTVADMAENFALNRRITAAAAKEDVDDPPTWAQENRWEVASQPGWDAAWDSAVAAENPDPGNDEAVITDGMILSGVQAVIADNNAPPEA